MKETFLFEYSNRTSAVSKLNPAVKLIALLSYSLMCGIVDWYTVPAAAVLLVPVMAASGRQTLRQMPALWKIVLFFALFAFIRFLNGEAPVESAAFFIRLLLMAAAAVIFYTTTGISELAAGVYTLLRPLPFVNSGRLSVIISSAAGFLPMIFRLSNQLGEARTARSFTPRAGLIRYIKLTALPLIISLLRQSEEMSDAYYSRCYTEDRRYRSSLRSSGSVIYPLIFVLLCLSAAVLSFF